MGQSSPGTSTNINKVEPDPVTQEWRQKLYTQAQGLYGQQPPAYYPGQTVTPFSTQTLGGLNYLQGMAQQGAPNLQAANDASARILSGANPAQSYATNAAQGGLVNQGMAGLQSAANQNIFGFANAANQNIANLGGAAGQGIAGVNTAAQQGAGALQGAAAQNIAGLQGAAQQGAHGILNAANQNTAAQVLPGISANQGIAGQLASFGGASNPYLDQLYRQGAEKVTNDVNARFSQAGRSGNNFANAEALGSSLGSLYSSIYAPAYENERNRQMQGLQAAGQLGVQNAGLYGDLLNSDASRALSGANAAAGLNYGAAGDVAAQRYGAAGDATGLMYGAAGDTANRLYGAAGDMAGQRYQGVSDIAGQRYGAAGDLASIYDAGLDRQLQGANLLNSVTGQSNTDALRAQGLLGSVYDYGQMPGQTMLGVGSSYENLGQEYLDDAKARYDYQAQAPYAYLNQYANILNGLPDFSGSTTTATQRNATNRTMGALGGAATGAQIGSKFGPWGAGIGAGIGGLFGLFG